MGAPGSFFTFDFFDLVVAFFTCWSMGMFSFSKSSSEVPASTSLVGRTTGAVAAVRAEAGDVVECSGMAAAECGEAKMRRQHLE